MRTVSELLPSAPAQSPTVSSDLSFAEPPETISPWIRETSEVHLPEEGELPG